MFVRSEEVRGKERKELQMRWSTDETIMPPNTHWPEGSQCGRIVEIAGEEQQREERGELMRSGLVSQLIRDGLPDLQFSAHSLMASRCYCELWRHHQVVTLVNAAVQGSASLRYFSVTSDLRCSYSQNVRVGGQKIAHSEPHEIKQHD